RIMKPATASALLLILLGLAWLRGSHSWDADMSTLQKRAGGADQNYNYQQAHSTPPYGQFSIKTPPKGGASISSSASRVQPGLLQWVKFW
uniref:Dermokine n=1 Tax=Sciurus vulgaris TaxID=55149 RepID=A0A8D2DVS5_SCIVU